MIITVDGPGGSGKSTVSRILARRFGLPCLNSGFIYRAVTLLVIDDGGAFEDHGRVSRIVGQMDLRFQDDEESTRVFLGDREVTKRLKDPDVTAAIYRVANDGYYRGLLVELQRRCAEPRGVVAEGRDMGTVIFPQADHKFYLDASPEVRARRQHHELQANGHTRSFADVLTDVLERDRHDQNREHAPLRVPAGADVIQTDHLGIKEVVDLMWSKVHRASSGVGSRRRVPGAGARESGSRLGGSSATQGGN